MGNRPSNISINPRQEWPEKFSELLDINIDAIDFSDPTKQYSIKYNPSPNHKYHWRFFELIEATGWVGDNIYLLSSPTTETVGWLSAWTDISGWTNQEILEAILVASHNPTVFIRWTVAFWLYEVWQILTTPSIEWRWVLWSWPTGILTSLTISPIWFTQPNPVSWTWYWNNDVNVVIVLWTTRTYTASLQDDQWRSANASWSYVGTFPYYWTSANITTLTKQSLSAIWSTYFQIDMVAETGWNKYKADFETANIGITWIQFYNTVSGTWEWMGWSKANSLALWTTSAVNHTVQGNVVSYTRYTHNWVDGASLHTRFYTN